MDALRAHVSQTSHNPEMPTYVRKRVADTAARAGWPEGRLAEAFMVVATA
jgi:hypothetical protein